MGYLENMVMNHDLLERAKWQHVFGMEVNGEYLKDVKIYRIDDKCYLSIQDFIIAVWDNIIDGEAMMGLYKRLSGDNISISRIRMLDKKMDINKSNRVEWRTKRPNSKTSRIIMDILDEKGIEFVTYEFQD